MASKRDREAKQASLAAAEEEFVRSYTKAFPSFVFHLDGVALGSAESRILDLGGVSFDLRPRVSFPPSL